MFFGSAIIIADFSQIEHWCNYWIFKASVFLGIIQKIKQALLKIEIGIVIAKQMHIKKWECLRISYILGKMPIDIFCFVR